MPVIVGVALGGALGASARYGLDTLIEERVSSVFPWATFAINVTGCFVIGILTEQLVDRHHLPAWIRVGLIVGVIGGYTTFSTFSQEAFTLIESRDFGVTILYAAGSIVLGILAVWGGTALGRVL
ncbi:MAG TPA: fluoride efflux transporter CrcB [Gaiellaceae bacterium]|nr:fluoride efflux transporter CrcB [Gaiellaceae bacterium]